MQIELYKKAATIGVGYEFMGFIQNSARPIKEDLMYIDGTYYLVDDVILADSKVIALISKTQAIPKLKPEIV